MVLGTPSKDSIASKSSPICSDSTIAVFLSRMPPCSLAGGEPWVRCPWRHLPASSCRSCCHGDDGGQLPALACSRTCQVKASAPGIMKCNFHPSFLWYPCLQDIAPPSPPQKCPFLTTRGWEMSPTCSPPLRQAVSCALRVPELLPTPPAAAAFPPWAASLEGLVERR